MPSTPVLLGVSAALMPTVLVGSLLCVLGAGGASSSPSGCGPAGTAETVLNVQLDAEQMANAQTIVTVAAGRGLPSYAAVVAVDTSYTEATLHNSTVETDHDSEGLFQQRVSLYTAAVADDPVKATNAFLDRLVAIPDWQDQPVGVDAQSVQRSAHPERYEPNASLAAALVGQFWPAAAAGAAEATTATPVPSSPHTSVSAASTPAAASASTTAAAPVVVVPVTCAGGDGAVPLTGGHGNNVAGTITIPAGLVMDGTAQGDAAAQFALEQLGKPYVFGASGPASFDCSGLTMSAWATQGVALAHYAATQAGQGTPEPTDLSQAVSGDLVLIPGADGTAAAPGHVGIIAGYTPTTTADGKPGRDLWLVQAPGYQNLPVELTEATQWSGQIVAVRHVA